MCRAISLRRLLLLLLQLSQLLAVTQGKTLVLGKEGESAELPCESSQKKITVFTWKFSDQRKILGQHGKGVLIRGGSPSQFDRFDSKKGAWEKGSFPLIINKLKMEDSQTYICELENRKEEVELWVFKVTFSPGTSLLQGQSLTLTLDSNSKVSNPLTECKHKKGKVVSGSKVLSMSNLRVQDSDFWNCTVTLDQKKNWFGMTLSVLGFQSTAITAYKSEGESAEFSFPLNFAEENGWGELMWKAEKDSFFQPWISFSIKNKEVSVQKSTKDLKLQLKETLPLTLKIPQVSLQFAGSGNLTLTLDKGTLHQEVNLVVMKVAQLNNTLTCEVMGPTSPKMRLTLKQENQEARVSEEQKVVQVVAPETGLWQCLLSEGDKVKMDSRIQVLSRGVNQTVFLACVLGGSFGFLGFLGLCILCCVRCRHQQRQAARMSQIKRLLSEKKTCQCPHRMQKSHNLI
ncbi:T-cell surface glycoprotein CD4 precursor [Mus musculus]|uniref:T-cell surface glycoprotein CD4 n=3 Tax=Mus musculus TaxID=10090 RepID=CD4_MOUSE|nr:T-cell surface glycoprotein CD4 precursor [Mus musculus]P06332.1 RecName: Full=T-cell surface glycoprotein CD4; AltName: Full=T-cell differentiation antigen L3T4; AltName: Full=T-cell surface antigen T4/Leu-3; AltName: CD_antigen=CD4; Flags: Precursor [Mus musculus]prf//1303332A glycoprotein CD4,T cell surface [Murid betaherpesvirus 1]AAA37267.1 L3T4 surface antigen precursor [Mus musculus]AAA39401.1 L3T4 differentiation antigen protein [Mus musculus]AAC36010.1 CD4 [Mus musculus]AAH39137.1|eukprot:NP_038516.1 T-cell surface glycoprotein CD4 precursor [Mus musculus]